MSVEYGDPSEEVPVGVTAKTRGKCSLFVSLALVWFAHIGFDRMVGYGLKYPTDFFDTHLRRT